MTAVGPVYGNDPAEIARLVADQAGMRAQMEARERRQVAHRLFLEDTVRYLDSLPVLDPEATHGKVDDLLLSLVPEEVAQAVRRVQDRAPWWGTA